MVTSRTKQLGTPPMAAKSPARSTQARTKKATGAPHEKGAAREDVAVTPPPASQTVKSTKQKKNKPVRDSFTMPKAEYAVLSDLKQRSVTLAHPAKKSELIRAGITVLATLSDAAFMAALKSLPAIKTGRPSKTESA